MCCKNTFIVTFRAKKEQKDLPSLHFWHISIQYVVIECHKTVCVCVCVCVRLCCVGPVIYVQRWRARWFCSVSIQVVGVFPGRDAKQRYWGAALLSCCSYGNGTFYWLTRILFAGWLLRTHGLRWGSLTRLMLTLLTADKLLLWTRATSQTGVDETVSSEFNIVASLSIISYLVTILWRWILKLE